MCARVLFYSYSKHLRLPLCAALNFPTMNITISNSFFSGVGRIEAEDGVDGTVGSGHPVDRLHQRGPNDPVVVFPTIFDKPFY